MATDQRTRSSRAGRWLVRLGVHRPEMRAWAMYDWANSAVWTTVIAAVFPIYFYSVAGADLAQGQATARFALATTAGLLIVAVLAPVLGATADFVGARKRMLGAFLALGVVATSGMFFVQRGDWLLALALFVVVEVGVSGSCVFYDGLLPHVARGKEVDGLSTTAYALGYLGGGLLLGLNLAWILRPHWFALPAGQGLTQSQASLPARLAFVSAAVWWVIFSVPLFRQVAEPPPRFAPGETAGRGRGALSGGLSRLRQVFADVRKHPQAFWMLLAFIIYSDGIGTIIRMAVIYGAEIGIGQGTLIASLLLVQFVGIPFAMIFGRIARRIGPKRTIYLGLVGYTAIAVFGFFIETATHFLILALGVAVVQGGTQALSRSLFASLIPRHKSAEFFSFFAVSERFAGILGPAAFAAVVLLTDSSRYAILSVIAFFVVGGAMLTRVDVHSGRRAAREAEASAGIFTKGAGTGAARDAEVNASAGVPLGTLAK